MMTRSPFESVPLAVIHAVLRPFMGVDEWARFQCVCRHFAKAASTYYHIVTPHCSVAERLSIFDPVQHGVDSLVLMFKRESEHTYGLYPNVEFHWVAHTPLSTQLLPKAFQKRIRHQRGYHTRTIKELGLTRVVLAAYTPLFSAFLRLANATINLRVRLGCYISEEEKHYRVEYMRVLIRKLFEAVDSNKHTILSQDASTVLRALVVECKGTPNWTDLDTLNGFGFDWRAGPLIRALNTTMIERLTSGRESSCHFYYY